MLRDHRGHAGSWIYNFICNQCLLSLKLRVRIPLRRDVFNTTLCNKICQWLVAGRWLSLDTSVSSTNKTDRHDISEIFLKVALSTIPITIANKLSFCSFNFGHCTSILYDFDIFKFFFAYNTSILLKAHQTCVILSYMQV